MASSSSASSVGSNLQGAVGDVVVWEWLNEYGRWRPYNPEIVVHIEKVGQVAPQVPLGAVSQGLRMYIVDIPSMCQIRQGTGTSRPVRRVFYPAQSPPGQQVVWEWSGDAPNEWHIYDMEIAVLIEDAFHSGKGMLDLSTSQFRLPYTVHFTTMQQVRIQTGKTRTIRRTSLKVPYPSAAAAPMSFSRLTSQLPATLHVNQPSASCQPGPSASSAMMMVPAAVPASNSVTHKRTFSTSGVDSGSDSDDGSGKSPPGRHGKYRRSTRSKSAASGAAGAPVSKGSKSSGLPSATQTSGSTQASTASGLASTSLSSLALSQTSPARTSMPGMLPPGVVASSAHQQAQPALSQPSNPMYSMPPVSLVGAGASVPLSLVTYAQPLGANLTRGFPPMTHVPPSPNSKSQPYQHLQQQAAPQHNGWPPMHVTNVPSASQTLGRLAPSQPNPSLHSQSHPHSQPQSSQGQGQAPMPASSSSSYHGPMTRNRLSSAMKVNSHSQHVGGSVSGMNGLSISNMVLGGFHHSHSQNSGLMNLMSAGVHQQHPHHQQQQQQQPVPGMGVPGYHFSNHQPFLMPLGMNMMSQHGLPLSSSGGSQHNRIAPSIPGGLAPPAPGGTQPTETLPPPQKIVLPKMKKTKRTFQLPKTAEEVLSKYMEKVSPQENEDCCICCDALTGPSSYGEGQPGQFDVIQLNKCSHMFHRLCLLAMYDSSHNHDSIQCPTCKTIYGEYIGNCPPGEMSFDIIQRSLPGFPGCNTIRVMYYISGGTQGPEHPHPGRRFTARGFPRTGYLPDTDRGRKILKMLILAFKRRLMFTIGQSATTGEGDTVTWNEIHHKTEFGSNVSGHGYPDPNYLDNVTAELALKGVTDQDL